ncbi:ExbD/TolR family protein [Sphingomicrobium astaxanthinifaciens]|uniref:ExbD/TolR family protein n=1 Tax=Sphingomicrobium astaxanthinifaciens TaxID=1227949 RepID=UPI001FCA9AD8|nr:biopolymer transporter ExbD [Sphingomicrobium astaxanthinifaciens]MCJ7420560.1 biopolymer transporter ExbD [Sphingomicrobium astaxanthinifaciens]
MGMNVGMEQSGDDIPMSDINTTPLVDVMLVLLIIFLIAVPVVLETVPVQLPTVQYEPTESKPENVNLSVRGAPDGTCEVYWNVQPVASDELLDRAVVHLEQAIEAVGGVDNLTDETMPEVHIRGDVDTPYKCIGGAIFTMQRAGFARVGFISEPPAGTAVKRL